jgi:hypothetical protein
MEGTVVGSQYPKPLIPLLLTILNPNIVQWEDIKETNHSWATVFKTTVPTKATCTSQVACRLKEVSNITVNKEEAVQLQASTTMASNSTSRIKIASLAFHHLPLEISTRVLAVEMGWCTSLITNLGYSNKLATIFSCENSYIFSKVSRDFVITCSFT